MDPRTEEWLAERNRVRVEIDRIRQEIDKRHSNHEAARFDVEPVCRECRQLREEITLSVARLPKTDWTMIATAFGAFWAVFAAGVAIGAYFIK